MKKLMFLAILVLFSFYKSQNLKKDSLGILYKFESTYILKKNFSESSLSCYFGDSESKNIDGVNFLFVTDIGRCNNKFYIKGYFFGREYYIEDKKENFIFFIPQESEKQYTFDEIENAFRNLDSNQREKIKNYSKYISNLILEDKIDKAFDYIDSFKKYSIAILDAHPITNYSMTGAKFKILNLSKKDIKYITFNFYGKNPVKDKVLYRSGVYNVSRKGIGPIESYATGTWEFDDVWLTDIVEYLTLTSMNIIYMDGTSRVIKVTDNLWIDEDKMNTFLKLSDFRDSLE